MNVHTTTVTDDPLHNAESAGEYIGGKGSPISPNSMRSMRARGVGPAYVKVGRLVRYRQSALEKFIRENTVDPA